MEFPPAVQSYTSAMSGPNRAIFERLARIAQIVDPSIQVEIKWRAPTFTVCGNWHHWLFSIAQTKKGVTLTFHKGWLLSDPARALQGEGQHMRQILFTAESQIPEPVVAALIRESIRRQTDME